MDKFFVGQIVKAQGIKGEVKVKSDASSLLLVKSLKTLFLDDTPVTVKTFRVSGDFSYVLFSTIQNRNAAELLVGKSVWAAASQVDLDENDYFTKDILGCVVMFEDGRVVGTIRDVLQNGKSADVLVCENVMFPFLKDVVLDVDTDKKTLVVDEKRFLEVALYDDED
jgi:16S rRNA processing protein RimM